MTILFFIVIYKVKVITQNIHKIDKIKSKILFLFICSIFTQSIETYQSGTLTITTDEEYNNRDVYLEEASHVIIIGGVEEIGENAFSDWMKLTSVEIGDCVTSIGDYAFYFCPRLQTITIGDNVKTIGSGAFQSCSLLTNIIIPSSVTKIGSNAFNGCSNLQCIYYYGESEPEIVSNIFNSVPAEYVMTFNSYNSDTFGTKAALKGTAVDGCSPMETQTFTQPHTFTDSSTFTKSNAFTKSNTFTKSNIFTKSNTFIKSNTITDSNTYTKSYISTNSNTYTYLSSLSDSLQFDGTFVHTIISTYSITQTIISKSMITNSISITLTHSTYYYIYSEFITYEYILYQYSTYYIYYSNFYTILHDDLHENDTIPQSALIGIICGAVIIVLLMIGLVLFLIQRKQKGNSNTQKEMTTISSSKDNAEVTNKEFKDFIIKENDQWL